MTPPPHDDPVGSVGDEAAKLLGALAGWAGDHLGGTVDGLGDGARDLNEHLATGDAECVYCPICRTVHAVRQASPEVKAQLAEAGSAFLQAAAALLAAASPADPASTRVQHIDLDSDLSTDPEDQS